MVCVGAANKPSGHCCTHSGTTAGMLAEPIKSLRTLDDETNMNFLHTYCEQRQISYANCTAPFLCQKMGDSRLQAILTKVANTIGYRELRPKQFEVISEFIRGRDVFVALPTGSGKSLCYSILPRAFDAMRPEQLHQSVAIVVSPLISLMKDQVRAMMERNLTAAYVGGANSDEEIRNVCEGEYQLVYMSPESLLKDSTWRDMLQSPVYQQRLVAFVVDEAHCVKKGCADVGV